MIQADFAGNRLPDITTTTVSERLLGANARFIIFFTFIILAPAMGTRSSTDSELRGYIIAIVLFDQLLFKLIVVNYIKL